MTWGIFDDHYPSHVIPTDDAGKIKPPHIISGTCPCCPRMDDNEKMVIHNEIQ